MPGEQLQLGDDERSIALKRAWERALHILAGKVNKVTFESYIRPIRPLRLDEQQITLGVASPFAREWLDKRYSTLIRAAVETAVGCPVEIRFSILSGEERPPLGDPNLVLVDHAVVDGAAAHPAEDGARPRSPGRRSAAARADAEPIPTLPLNEAFTFDNFVVGKCNRLAQAGAAAVAAAPGGVYNPLFVYGGSGLGKTHLLHAIGHAAQATNPRLRVAMMDGENFTQHYVAALRERRTDEFRRRYRSVDIWLVDDIQFIAGREQTKEEFFHTFNSLHQTGKQIVISSDRSPRELRLMDERLRSRFECGLIADINPPELETRMAILERRCEKEHWNVSGEVLSYIASAIQSNIRALEGALNKLVAYSSVMSSPYSIELAQSVLGEYFIEKPLPGQSRKGVSVETILRAVAEEMGTSPELIRGQRRHKEIALARQVAMYFCRELTGDPLAQIGAAVGGRDHTTVQRAAAKIDALLRTDAGLRAVVEQIRSQLQH